MRNWATIPHKPPAAERGDGPHNIHQNDKKIPYDLAAGAGPEPEGSGAWAGPEGRSLRHDGEVRERTLWYGLSVAGLAGGGPARGWRILNVMVLDPIIT